MNRPLARRFLLATAGALLAFAVAPAGAEQSGRDGVAISFDGSFAPRAVPRERLAPITLTLDGKVRSTDGSPPPRLARIEIAFGARGGLDTTGLPVCPRSRLRNSTQREALARCHGALVGSGEISTEVPLDPRKPLLARAALLAFNGRSHGRPAVWVHAYAASPPVSFVLPFYLSRPRAGAYGVLLRAPVSSALGRWPRLRSFHITLGRRYGAGGDRHSYLSAHCPLPPRLTALSVPFARTTYYFAPRPKISQSISRFCQVRQ
jgi:hypothetical protein